MSVTVTPPLSEVYAKLRSFLLTIVPSGTEVVRGQSNRVPQPVGPHAVMQLITERAVSTNTHAYDDASGTQTVQTYVELRMQLDFYGELSGEYARAVGALLRDPLGCDALAPVCQPLHADDAFQSPLITGEHQYLQRWTLEAFLQWNPTVTVSQQFADTLLVTLVNIDVEYPP